MARPAGIEPAPLGLEGRGSVPAFRRRRLRRRWFRPASDRIVYIAVRRLINRRLAGGLHFVAATASDRILRVTLNVNVDRVEVLAVLGHELRHAAEIAEAREVRSREAFDRHYQFHGENVASLATLDTPAARDAEARVRRDLAGTHRAGDCGGS